MIVSIVVILLVGVIAYFHWVQGLFSALISATVAAIAAVLAFSYHEPLATLMSQGKMSDQAYAITLVALFAVIYLVGRVIFDNAIPGNIRLPAMVDKVGGAIAGAIAGMFALGILVIAAESLPFGVSVAGYARYTLKDEREVALPNQGRQAQDVFVEDELKSDSIDPNVNEEGLLLPVDDFVVGAVRQLSDGGALEGDRPLKSVHPAYLNELFFQRLGVQVGAKHVIQNTAKLHSAEVQKVFALQSLPQAPGEMKEIRPPDKDAGKPLESNGPKQIVVIRVNFGEDGSDDDHLVRLSPASVRLVADGKDYIPIGTLYEVPGTPTVLLNKPDDFLVVRAGQAADFVYYVDREDVLRKTGGAASEDDKNKQPAAKFEFKKGAFVEVKRMIRIDLTGTPISTELDLPGGGIMRKQPLIDALKNAGSKT